MKEPFINNMFPGLFLEPEKKEYEKRVKKITLCSFYKALRCKHCGDEDCFEYCDDALEAKKEENEERNSPYNWSYKDQPPIPNLRLKEVNLQSILDMLPEGVSPKDIKLELFVDSDCMSYNGIELEVTYTKEFPPDPEGYKRDKTIYDDCVKQYKEARKKYENWKIQQEINELETKLRKLKK